MKIGQWNSQPEQPNEKRVKKNEDSLRDLWNNIKWSNIRVIGIPEEEREKVAENLFEEVMGENFPNLGKETNIQIQDRQRVSNRMNSKTAIPSYFIIKQKENFNNSK